jgi:hypothetical protein
MDQQDITTGRWDPERREFIIGVGHHVLHVTDVGLDDWRYDLDNLTAHFVNTFRGPEFERVREGLRPGYEAMQTIRKSLRLKALDQAVTEVCAPISDMIPDAIEAALAKRGYRIVRSS